MFGVQLQCQGQPLLGLYTSCEISAMLREILVGFKAIVSQSEQRRAFFTRKEYLKKKSVLHV